ncbi:MAG: hypothetical protein Ct9H300mP1_23890 [Planctomycetaceae bacterium]|nr:MAG: hypothetical protein Ct9H300mP1_23890 [Planctomycetaceae bacterium]
MLKLGLIDSGPVAVSDWQAASDRLSDVTIVDADAADAVLVAGVDAANQATESGRHVLLVPGSLQSSEEAADLAAPDGTVVMLAATGRFQPSIREVQAVNSNGSLGSLGLLRIHRWLPGGDPVGITCRARSTGPWPTGCSDSAERSVRCSPRGIGWLRPCAPGVSRRGRAPGFDVATTLPGVTTTIPCR